MKHLLILLTLISINSYSQSKNPYNVDLDMLLIGGKDKMENLILENCHYPNIAKENGTQGIVVIGFTLTKEAKIINIKTVNTIGDGCDEEAIRVFKLTEGNWKPYIESGQTVDKYFEYEFKYSLTDSKKVESIINRVNKLYSSEKYSDALMQLNEVIKRDPYNTSMLLIRGICKHKTGDKKGACDDWNRVKFLGDINAEKYLNENCKD